MSKKMSKLPFKVQGGLWVNQRGSIYNKINRKKANPQIGEAGIIKLSEFFIKMGLNNRLIIKIFADKFSVCRLMHETFQL